MPRRDKPDFSNVKGGASTTAPRYGTTPSAPAATPAPERPAPASTAGVYTVKSGDSLWKIAKHHYGDGNQWRRIYEANKDTIKDPDLIYPGQELRLPAD
jgi:nucleoid-associated protein YgaU